MPRFDPVPPTVRGKGLAFLARFALCAAVFFAAPGVTPAFAQGISLLRDTETEDMLRSYETPLAKAAGLDPVPRVWLIGSPEVNAFASYGDPDANRWLLQEVTVRLPGRVDATETTFSSSTDLADALRRAEAAHAEHEKRTGQRDAAWADWYAEYMVAEHGGTPLPT